MKIYKYGSYEEYVKAQTDANKMKLKRIWAKDYVLKQIPEYVENPKKILCHGTRNGGEIKMFQDLYPEADIIGTEISETATQFENTVQHDFNNPKEEWIGEWDLIYSNSFDHTYDPTLCLNTWKDQLSTDGIMFIELPIGDDNKSCKSDPLQIHENEFRKLSDECGLQVFTKLPGRYWANFTVLGSELYGLKKK